MEREQMAVRASVMVAVVLVLMVISALAHISSGRRVKRETQEREETLNEDKTRRPIEREGGKEYPKQTVKGEITEHYIGDGMRKYTKETTVKEASIKIPNGRRENSTTTTITTAPNPSFTFSTRATRLMLTEATVSRCQGTPIRTQRMMGAMLSPNNGLDFGEWGPYQQCAPGSYAHAFQIRAEAPLGLLGDDTALNGIRLFCQSAATGAETGVVTSSVQCWGTWRERQSCSAGGFLMGMALRVEGFQGLADDVAATDLLMVCEDGTMLEGGGLCWGTFSILHTCPPDFAICGIKTRVEGNTGFMGDNTALNDVIMYCCLMV